MFPGQKIWIIIFALTEAPSACFPLLRTLEEKVIIKSVECLKNKQKLISNKNTRHKVKVVVPGCLVASAWQRDPVILQHEPTHSRSTKA